MIIYFSVCNGTTLTSGCCTSSSPCQIGGGVCSSDDQCEGSLKCGTNYCRYFHPNAISDSKCCYGKLILFSSGVCGTSVVTVTSYIFQILQYVLACQFYKHQLDNRQSALPRPIIQVIRLILVSLSLKLHGY